MKIAIINTALPPKLDAIGHYTKIFAEELRRFAEVRILLPEGSTYDPIEGIVLEPCFSVATPEGIRGLIEPVVAAKPDWLLLQYNPFMYGKWGRAPQLVPTLRELKRRCPNLRIAVMVHENFVPFGVTWKFSVMATWQVPQYGQLLRTVDVLFGSTTEWVTHAQKRFPRLPCALLPVGSTIARVELSREAARQRLGISPETKVVGLFGTAHISRMLPLVASSLREARSAGYDARLLYIGPDGDAIRTAMGDIEPLRAEGPLPEAEVSARFHAMDVYLVPFIDGVSTRRTSMMTALQHGIATLGTLGHHTDPVLRDASGSAFCLAPVHEEAEFSRQLQELLASPERCEQIGMAGRQLYETQFDWPIVVQKCVEQLSTKP